MAKKLPDGSPNVLSNSFMVPIVFCFCKVMLSNYIISCKAFHQISYLYSAGKNGAATFRLHLHAILCVLKTTCAAPNTM